MNEQDISQTPRAPGVAPKGDVGTQLANQRTDLAMERNYMAAERTLMGWIRTALSMISFGFTIGKLRDILGAVEVKGIFVHRSVSVESIAFFLINLGTLSLLAAALQQRRRVHDLCAGGLPRRFNISFYVALALTVVGVFALSSLMTSL
jgi:putative membrane protein